MRDAIFAGLAGLVFAVGLAVGGMTDPARVQGFLDLFGRWDPTLAFVMGGALGVYALLSRIVVRRRGEVVSPRRIDARLVGGAALFGIGWGLAGYCPGPAFVSAGTGGPGTLLFVVAMLGGFVVFRLWRRA